jgi:hypothetical protein
MIPRQSRRASDLFTRKSLVFAFRIESFALLSTLLSQMKRIEQKVKDIVEVRSYENLVDFTADPERTFANYHFTDVTSELMAKWIDGIAGLRDGKGLTLALAGYRGVGKSHFLATLGAIVGQPELRLKITDAHVATSAQRLMRRHYPLIYVRRGTGESLTAEFIEALKPVLPSADENASVRELLSEAVVAGDLPLIIMIDTAIERTSRVARDDGPFLAEIAEAAKELNVFVGVVLDDDIAGADGVNAVISRAFAIDYLDQEHLFKVVNAFVFPKNSQMQPVLHDVYEYFRTVVPGFRWSEQRFASLYPLHPAILEVAPYVRLYVHDFALLGFASTAAERILGRPATSLISLDEVFDKSEKALRSVEELGEGFAAYDTLNEGVVNKLPVMQRLWAKLVLKALLLLSLDGRGTTAAEIAGSMLIYDEAEPEKAVANVENLIREFANALPTEVRIDPDEGRGERYAFRLTSREDLNRALAEKAGLVTGETVDMLVRRFFNERFSDSLLYSDKDPDRNAWMDCSVGWKGSLRPGRISWSADGSTGEAVPTGGMFVDWEVAIHFDEQAGADANMSLMYWKPAKIRPDEIDIINRYYVLSTDRGFRELLGDETRASLHSHSVSVEKIINRLFLEDGQLTIDGFDYNFTTEARATKTLTDLFSVMLEPVFETRFPEHPHFTEHLSMQRVVPLISDLYSGTRQRLPEVQDLAMKFGLPLGIVKLEDGYYVPRTDEALTDVVAGSTILEIVANAGESSIPLENIYAELHKEPFGLTRETQHLLLTSLVAQRQIDFITSQGDRISRRSLDLEIIWDDITAVAKTVASAHSAKNLSRWAAVFTENKDIQSLDNENSRRAVTEGLESWLANWNGMRFVQRFDALPDDQLSTRIWKMATDCGRVFGPVADHIARVLDGTLPLEECLNRIAEAFSDSEEVFEKTKSQLLVVDSFIKGAPERDKILSYLAMCEFTDDDEIEETREQLYQVVDRSRNNPSDASNREMGYLWIKFQRDFVEYFARKHEDFMSSGQFHRRLAEIERSEQWWAFENLVALPLFDRGDWEHARAIRNEVLSLHCRSDVAETLNTRPFCSCGFHLSRIGHLQSLPEKLEAAVQSGLEKCMAEVSAKKSEIADRVAKAPSNAAFKADAGKLAERIRNMSGDTTFSIEEFNLLHASLACTI